MKKNLYRRLLPVLFLVVCAVVYIVAGTKTPTPVAAAGDETKITSSYEQCENNDEDVWYELVDDAISEKAVAYEEAGIPYTISDENEVDDGFFTTIDSASESTVVAGITIDGTNYVVTLTSDKAISNEDAENAIYDVFEEIIVAAEGLDE